jgi:hypothetical protein
MIVFKPLIRLLAGLSLLSLFVFAFGYLSRDELDRASVALTTAIASSSELVDRCDSEVTRSMRAELVTYLAIEDYFRPNAVRKIEFLLAALGAQIGMRPVQTIGIGQIAYTTYVAAHADDAKRSGVASLINWIEELYDDCNNVRILEKIAERDIPQCAETNFVCFVSSICLWHTGSLGVCLQDTKYQAYVGDVVTTYARFLRVSQQQFKSHRSKASLD